MIRLPLRQSSRANPDLETMSIEELQEYIADMEAEIARVKQAIEAKTSHRGAADGFFRR